MLLPRSGLQQQIANKVVTSRRSLASSRLCYATLPDDLHNTTRRPASKPFANEVRSNPSPAQPPPSTGAPRLIRHPPVPSPSGSHASSAYPAPHYYSPPSPLGASALIAKQRAARGRSRSRFDSLPLFQFRSSLAEVDFDSPVGWDYREAIRQQQQQQQQAQTNPSSTPDRSIRGMVASAQSTSVASTGPTELAKRATTKTSAAEVQHRHSEAEHKHEHSHGILGHSHHHHDHGSPEEADRLIAALKGQGDRGSNITLLGLFSNIVLCISKGVAGVFLNSASLVADAAHSLSDMLSDVVTLFCWKMSQKPPSRTHPLGYGKYETMGGLGVSVVLVGGAVGIGLHSWGLFLESIGPMLASAPSWIQTIGAWTHSLADWGGHSHGGDVHAHGHEGGVLHPSAMLFALASVLVKEWLYRATLKIAKEENSSVLEANAIHHRSDSLSSGVTFLAIGGSWLGLPILDPLGGLLVAALIGKQGFELMISALRELSDRGVDLDVLEGFEGALDQVQSKETRLVKWSDLRAVKSGVSTFVDVTLIMRGSTNLTEAREVEDKVRDALVEAHKGVKEVRVHLAPSDD